MEKSVTKLEKEIIINIAENDYSDGNGAEPTEYMMEYGNTVTTWTNCVGDCGPNYITGKTLSGGLASLTKKGYVNQTKDGKESTTWLTEEGFKIYRGIKEGRI